MIAVDAVHPPAVATAMSFALRAGDESNLALFGVAVAVTAMLVVLQRSALWILTRAARAALRRGAGRADASDGAAPGGQGGERRR